MLNFFKKMLGLPTAAEKVAAKDEAPAPMAVEGAGVVTAGITTNWPFPLDEKPAEGKKKPAAKKARAPKDPSTAPKKPRAKKAK
jgi:hypothetical protein